MPFGLLGYQSSMQPAVQSPVGQPAPQEPQLPDELLRKIAELWRTQGELQPAAYRAATLRQDQPFYAKGEGPLGMRMGVGPGGWAVTLADAVNGILGRKQQEESDALAMAAMAKMANASGDYAGEKLKYGGINPRVQASPSEYKAVPQGTPLAPVNLLDPFRL